MSNKLTFFAFLTVSILLGVNFLFTKLTQRELPPFTSAAIRFLLASTILFLICLYKKIKLPRFKEIKIPILYGLLTFGLNSGLLSWGLQNTPSEIASLIYSTIPLTTILLSSFLKIERITKKHLTSSILVIGGISIIFSSELRLNIEPLSTLAILIASFFAASSTFLVKKCANLHPLTLNTVAMFSGGVCLLMFSVYLGEGVKIPALGSTWVGLFWLTISSCVAFVLMTFVVKKWKPRKASYSSVLIPIITIVASSLLSNNFINLTNIVGTTIVLSGVIMNLYSNS